MAIVASGLEIAFWSIIIPSVIGIAMKLFSSFFYAIGKLLFWVIDILQTVFRKLAGLDTIWMNGEQTDGDILLSIFRSQVVVDTLISVTVFAVALVIVATIVQMVRTEYTTEGSRNSKEGILGQALKSLVMFILIPVVCFFGIRVSNYLLQAVDYATSSGGSQSISGAIFNASTIDANKVVNKTDGGHEFSDLTIGGILDWILPNTNGAKGVKYENGAIMKFEDTLKSNQSDDTKARQEIGKKIDQLMAMNEESAKKFGSAGYGEGVNPTGKIYYGNIAAVRYFYDMGEINFLILYVGAYLVLQALFNASMGLVVRMYKATALFVIAPAAIGLQPLDGGNTFKKWRQSFLQTVLAAYGVIVALNIFFVVAGVVSQIELWDPKGSFLNYCLNKFMQALFIVVGATQIKGLAKTMGDLIGGADAMSEGASATGEATKLVGSVAKVGVGAAVAGKAIGHGIAGKVQEHKIKSQERKADVKAINDKFANKMNGATRTATGGWLNADGRAITDSEEISRLNRLDSKKNKALAGASKAQAWLYDDQKDKKGKSLGIGSKADQLRMKAAKNSAKMGQSFNAVAGMIGDSAPVKTLMGLTGGSVFKSAASGKMFKDYDEEYAKTGIPASVGLESGTKLGSFVSNAVEAASGTGLIKKGIHKDIGYLDARKAGEDMHNVTQKTLDDAYADNEKMKTGLLDKAVTNSASRAFRRAPNVVEAAKSLMTDDSLSATDITSNASLIRGRLSSSAVNDALKSALDRVIASGGADSSALKDVKSEYLKRFSGGDAARAYENLSVKNAKIQDAKTKENEAFDQKVKKSFDPNLVDGYSQAVKDALSGSVLKMDDDETQATLKQLLRDGVIRTEDEGEKSVKLDYARINKTITDAFNKQKRDNEAADKEAKAAKEQTKALKDILKELKKKK